MAMSICNIFFNPCTFCSCCICLFFLFLEHLEITKYLKKDEEASAFAMAIAQHERVVLEQIKDCGLIEGENLYTVWQEDLLDDAWTTYGNVMKFLELDMNDKQQLEWLEAEDFPNGQANKKRIESKSNKVKEITFGKETQQIDKILEACLQRFNNHRLSRQNKKMENENKNGKDDEISDWSMVDRNGAVGNGK